MTTTFINLETNAVIKVKPEVDVNGDNDSEDDWNPPITNEEKAASSPDEIDCDDEESDSTKPVPDPLHQDPSLEEVILFQNPALSNLKKLTYRGLADLKKVFHSEMEASIHSIVNECIGVLHRDPREYHPFYLRVHKWISIGQHHDLISTKKITTTRIWTSFDNYAAQQYKSYQDNPDDFKFEGEHSPYLTYVLTQKVILAGIEVTPKRDEEQVAKQFSELDSLVAKLRWDAASCLNFRTNLKRRLEFFEHCKHIRYPGDTIKMMDLWALLFSPRPTHKSLKPKPPPKIQKHDWPKDLPPEELKRLKAVSYRVRRQLTGWKRNYDNEKRKRPTKEEQKLWWASLPEEKKKKQNQRGRFYRLQKKIEEDMMPEEERERRKTERFLKLSAYLATKPKEFLERRKERRRERNLEKRETMTVEERKLINERNRARVKRLEGEKLDKLKEMQRAAQKKYMEKVKAEEPERYEEMMKRMKKTTLINYKKRLESETEEQREKRLLYYRVRQAKRKAKKKIEEEGGYTEEEIQRRLEEVEAAERAKPRPNRPYVYKPKPRLNKKNESEEEEEVELPMRKRGRPPVYYSESSDPPNDSTRPGPQVRKRSRPDPLPLLSLPSQPKAMASATAAQLPVKVDYQYRNLPGSSSASNPTLVHPSNRFWDSTDSSTDNIPEPATPPDISSNPFFNDDYDDDRDSMPPTRSPIPHEEDDDDILSNHSPEQKTEFNAYQTPSQETSKPPENTVTDLITAPKKEEPCIAPPTPPPATIPTTSSSTSASHICDECGSLFLTRSQLTTHKNRAHNPEVSTLECSECQLPCSNADALWDHFVVCHTGGKKKPYRPRPSSTTLPMSEAEKRKQYNQRRKLKQAIYSRQTEEPNICPHCAKTFHQKCTLTDHIRRVHERVGTHTCPECGSDMQSKAKLWRHRVNRHGLKDLPPPEGLAAVVCQFCSEVVLRGYPEHVKRKHPEHAETCTYEQVKDEATGQDLLKCPHSNCKSTFASEATLKIHLKGHTRQKSKTKQNLTCPDCDKTFTRRSHLTRHYHTIHTFGDLYRKLEAHQFIRVFSQNRHKCQVTCLICQKELTTSLAVKAHFVSEHIEKLKEAELASVGVVECTFCHDKFPDKTKLQDHLKSNHKDDIFNCQYCGEVKCSKAQLEMHEYTHVRQDVNDKPGICKVCKAVFSPDDLTSLWEHVREHHPSNYFQCVAPSCETKYYSNESIWAHMRQCEKANECAGDIQEIRKFIIEKLAKVRVCCPDCGEGVKLRLLDNHREKSHGIPVCLGTTCEQCGGCFRQYSFYIAHCSVAHNIQMEELVKVAPERSKRKKKIKLEDEEEEDDEDTDDDEEEDEWNIDEEEEKKSKKRKIGSRRRPTPKVVGVGKSKATRTSARLKSQGRGGKRKSCGKKQVNVEREKRLVIKLVRLSEEDINRYLGRSKPQVKVERQAEDCGVDDEVEVKYCPDEFLNV